MNNPTPITPIPDALSHPSGEDAVVISYTKYIPIQSLSLSSSSPSLSSQPIDSIGFTASPLAPLSITKKDEQKVLSKVLKAILSTFLQGDCSLELPELVKWVGWSSERGYSGSRIIVSGNRLHLLASRHDGEIDDYELPFRQGGVRKPVLRHTFTSAHLAGFEEMSGCHNLTGIGKVYCGFCPACLGFTSHRKTFVNKKGLIDRLERELVDLEQMVTHGDKVMKHLRQQLKSALRNGWRGLVRLAEKELSRREPWVSDPQRHIQAKTRELARLEATRWEKELTDQATLMQVPHWFVSISCPTALHGVFDAQDAWLPERVWGHGRRASDAFQGLLNHVSRMPGMDQQGFVQITRRLFRILVVEAVESVYPGIELTMEHQMHPCNKFDNAPDVHFLICRLGRNQETGELVNVEADEQIIRCALEARMQVFAEFVAWAVKRWNGGCRATEFTDWRRDVLEGVASVIKTGIAPETVAVQLRPVVELLGTHRYLRRQPNENIEGLFHHRDTGMVDVRYRDGKRASFSLIDLLWRFVGFDGRGLGVQYTGAYRSVRGVKRNQRVNAMYRALELMQDDQKAMLKVKIDGAENDGIQNL